MNNNNEPKQVIVMRSDLRNSQGHKIRTGKLIAQGSHASMKAILDACDKYLNSDELVLKLSVPKKEYDPAFKWLFGRFTKVCVSVDSEQELIDIYTKAEEAGIQCKALITDAGLTEFNGVPTLTCCAIGPAFPEDIDKITGHLRLL